MVRIMMLVAAVAVLAGCSGGAPTSAPLTGDAVVASLTKTGLPVTDVRNFTTENDPNALLGRPNQYTAKVSWKDTRAPADDATVEVFPDAAALKARKDYTEGISRTGGPFAQYVYANKKRLALLRLPHQLTPEQATAYETWLATL